MKLEKNGSSKDVPMMLHVLPYENGTDFIFATFKEHSDVIERYMKMFQPPVFLEALSLIETWMINGVDFWFISPSVWDKKSRSKQEKILRHLNQNTYGIFHHYRGSIFDDLRRKLIRQAEIELATSGIPKIDVKEIKNYLKKERKKLR